MSAENETADNREAGEQTIVPDRSSVLAVAEGLRTCLRLHQQMGIDRYPSTSGLQEFLRHGREHVRRGGHRSAPAVPARPRPEQPVAATPPPHVTNDVKGDRLSTVRRDLEGCALCSLATARRGLVPGSGAVAAPLLIIGDHCRQEREWTATILFGAEEDVMLWNMMRAIGLGPGDVYVTNTVKCCPLDEQQSLAESERACAGYLQREIALVQPRVILAMGEAAARAVLGTSEPVFRLRGRLHRGRQSDRTCTPLPVMVTFHPRYLLGQAAMKKAAWQDLQIIQRHLRMSAPTGGPGQKTT